MENDQEQERQNRIGLENKIAAGGVLLGTAASIASEPVKYAGSEVKKVVPRRMLDIARPGTTIGEMSVETLDVNPTNYQIGNALGVTGPLIAALCLGYLAKSVKDRLL